MSIEFLKNVKATRPNIETCIKCLKNRNPRNNTCFSLAFISHPIHQPDNLVVFTPFYHFATCHVPFIVYWQTDSQRKEGFVYRQFWLSENGVLSNQLSSPHLFNLATLSVGRKGMRLCMYVGRFVLNKPPFKVSIWKILCVCHLPIHATFGRILRQRVGDQIPLSYHN